MSPKCCKNKIFKKEIGETVTFLKVISEKNRLKILCLLKEKDMCVCDIWQYLNLAQNLTSHHLKTLKNLKLVSSKRDGSKVMYSINKNTINTYTKLLNKFLQSYEK